MRKEVSIVALLLAAVLLFVYLFNIQFTGFAVFQQQTSNFSLGEMVNTSLEGSSVVLNSSANATTGTYTSEFFDSGNESTTWNNLTFTGQGSLTFEVRACSDINCTNVSFASADLGNLSLMGQYLQYMVTLEEDANVTTSLDSVVVDYSVPEQAPEPTAVTVDLTSPAGDQSSTPIPLEFTVTGQNLTCWYNVENQADGSLTIGDTILGNCTNSEFHLDFNGNFVLTIYANDSAGNTTSDSVSFEFDEDVQETSETQQEETPGVVPESTPSSPQIAAGEISALTLNPGSSRDLTWTISNTGNAVATSCKASATGDLASWVSVAESITNLGPSDAHTFTATVNVPEDAAEGQYTLSLSSECAETAASRTFTVNVEQKKLDLEILDAQRTRLDRVRVIYSLTELIGEGQDVQVVFTILDEGNEEVGAVSQNRSVDANETDDFTANIGINESLNGTMTLSVVYNSEVYSSSVLEPIDLSSVTGAAIFGGLGTGGVVLLVVVALSLVVILFVVRRLRRSGKPFRTLFSSSPRE